VAVAELLKEDRVVAREEQEIHRQYLLVRGITVELELQLLGTIVAEVVVALDQ